MLFTLSVDDIKADGNLTGKKDAKIVYTDTSNIEVA